MTALHSISAEQSVIGGLLLEPDTLPDISCLLHESDFVKREHALIFRAIGELTNAGTPIDVLTIREHLELAHKLNDAGGPAYIAAIAKDTPSASNIRAYAGIVAACAKRRQVRDLFTAAAKRAESAEDVSELIGDISACAEGIASKGASADQSFAEAWRIAIEAMDEAANARGGIVGVPTGIPAIDRRTGGLLQRRLIILAARPSIGKTALAQQIALHAASKGYPGGIISLEMSAEELMTRSMANMYGLNVSALTFGNDAELTKLSAAAGRRSISTLPIWMDTDTYSLGGIVARLSEWRRKHCIQLAIIDHIGLIDGGDNLSRNDHLGKITRTLKITAKRLGIPIIAVCQLNRAVERDKRRPVLADLRDSGSIEQDADVAVFLHTDPNEERVDSSVRLEIGLLKNRIGMTGWLPEHLTFDGRTQRIREVVRDQHHFAPGHELTQETDA